MHVDDSVTKHLICTINQLVSLTISTWLISAPLLINITATSWRPSQQANSNGVRPFYSNTNKINNILYISMNYILYMPVNNYMYTNMYMWSACKWFRNNTFFILKHSYLVNMINVSTFTDQHYRYIMETSFTS